METLKLALQRMLPKSSSTAAVSTGGGVGGGGGGGSPPSSGGSSSSSSSSSPTSNNLNNNNNILNKRNYPFGTSSPRHLTESKIAKISELSFRPLVQKVFVDSEIIKLKVNPGALPGDNFTSVIYAVEAFLKSPHAIHHNNNNNNNNNNASDDGSSHYHNNSHNHNGASAVSPAVESEKHESVIKQAHAQKNSEEVINCRSKDEPVERLHLVMKCFPNHPARQDFFRKIDIFRKELDVYRIVLPELLRFQKEQLIRANGGDDSSLSGEAKSNLLLSAFPRFYGGAYGDDYDRYWENTTLVAHGNFILMEDVRRTQGYKMLSKYLGLDLPHCKLVVSELAKLHALSMAYIKVNFDNKSSLSDHFDCLKETIVTPQTEEVASALFNASFGTSVQIVIQETGEESIYSQKMRRFGNRVHWIFGHILAGNGDLLTLYEMLKEKPNFADLHDQNKERKRDNWFVLTHGDCYVNNILFKYDPVTNEPTSVKMVDLQIARENSLTIDLVNFVYLSTTQAFRRENLDKILQTYYDSFISACRTLGVQPYADFTMANLVQKFHRAKIWGMLNSLFVLPVVLADANDEQKTVVDIDNVDGLLSASQMFDTLLKQGSKSNEKLYTRVVQLVQEMVEEGVI